MKVRLPSVSQLVSPPLFWVALAALAVTALMPAAGIGTPMCGLLRATGRPCFGCGMTRALAAITHGDLDHAWTMHPFSFLVWPLMTALAAAAIMPPWRRTLLESVKRWDGLLSRAFWIGVAVFTAYGAYRFFAAPPGAYS